MGLQSSSWLLLALASLPAVAADPPAKPAANAVPPGEELLEYLGTWNGDEEWLHSEDLLPPPSNAGRDRSATDRQRESRAPVRDPSEP
jgi:hypothetical protein